MPENTDVKSSPQGGKNCKEKEFLKICPNRKSYLLLKDTRHNCRIEDLNIRNSDNNLRVMMANYSSHHNKSGQNCYLHL